MLLAGDIGGTKTELAVFSTEHGLRAPMAHKLVPSRDYPSLETMARRYRADVDLPVTHAYFAVAVPVVGDAASLTNLPWGVEESSLQGALGLDFAPSTPRETQLLRYLQARWGRVSYERVCAGQSIPDLYDFLNDEGQTPESPSVRVKLAAVEDRTPTIMAAGLAWPDPDPLCLASLNMFVSILGAQAGNPVLTALATGGLCIGGGIPQRMLPVVTRHGRLLLSTFTKKGRLSQLLTSVPVHVIIEPVALLGAALHGLGTADSAGRV